MKKRAHQLKENELLINLGFIEKVELYEVAQQVRITITKGFCESAAFYWFKWNTLLTIEK